MICITMLFALCCQEASAAVNWRIHGGAMYSLRGKYIDDSGPNITAMFGCEIQFPIKEKFFIETGLNYRYGPTTFTEGFLSYNHYTDSYKVPLKDFDSHGKYIGSKFYEANIYQANGDFIGIPLRFTYRYHLKGNNEFQFAFGPYAEVYFNDEDYTDNSPILVGLSPAVVFKHRALSLGLIYQNPCIYNGIKNRDTNSLMFTVGVNFNGRKVNLDNLVIGLEAASAVLTSATETMSQFSGSANSSDTGSYSSGSSYSSASSSQSSSGSDFSLSKATSAQRDRSTYFQNETIVIKIINGDDTTNKIGDIQRKMKQLRNKWKGTQYEWQPSPYESR